MKWRTWRGEVAITDMRQETARSTELAAASDEREVKALALSAGRYRLTVSKAVLKAPMV